MALYGLHHFQRDRLQWKHTSRCSNGLDRLQKEARFRVCPLKLLGH